MLDKCDFSTLYSKNAQVYMCFNPFFTFALDKCDFSITNVLSINISSNASILLQACKTKYFFFLLHLKPKCAFVIKLCFSSFSKNNGIDRFLHRDFWNGIFLL